ncbi:MAG: hypothetical protein HYX41_02865 [Bdellovibrio sp.]|nr:hypothetical protein [Bdellovibrio sp.]
MSCLKSIRRSMVLLPLMISGLAPVEAAHHGTPSDPANDRKEFHTVLTCLSTEEDPSLQTSLIVWRDHGNIGSYSPSSYTVEVFLPEGPTGQRPPSLEFEHLQYSMEKTPVFAGKGFWLMVYRNPTGQVQARLRAVDGSNSQFSVDGMACNLIRENLFHSTSGTPALSRIKK